MTVKQLIARLNKLPSKLEVVIGDGSSIEGVEIDRIDNVCNTGEDDDTPVALLTH